MRVFSKILIANRGEVVERVAQACLIAGIKPVVVYEAGDVYSAYIHQAYQAYKLSRKGVQAYLNQDELIAIALQAGVNAIHPGYGFLSENALFAQAVCDAGIHFIGPSPETIKLLGDKKSARQLAQHLGIPIIPGIEIDTDVCVSVVIQKVAPLGYPLLIKDPLSGGGKGVAIATDAATCKVAFERVKHFAQRVTGATSIVIERYLPSARHVEVQIVGDGENVVHLYERDCTVQRNYQKIIEEAPCQFVNQSTLDAMYADAVMLAKYLNYKTLGTVEFLVQDNNYYFLEMNTRLQVEHGVTELLTGLDLVDLQLSIAQGNCLPFVQSDVQKRGHVMQCRVYAERPEQNFLPATGNIDAFVLPQHCGVRYEHDLYENKLISHEYDPMLLKIVVDSKNRIGVIKKMLAVLQQLIIHGVATNTSFLQDILCSSFFKNGNFATDTFSKAATVEHIRCKKKHDNDIEQEIALSAAAISYFLRDQQSYKGMQKPSQHTGWKPTLWKQKNFT